MQDKSFKSEDNLFKLFFKHKVFFAQGSVFYSKEPGWFRIIFTQNLETLQVGTYDCTFIISGVKFFLER